MTIPLTPERAERESLEESLDEVASDVAGLVFRLAVATAQAKGFDVAAQNEHAKVAKLEDELRAARESVKAFDILSVAVKAARDERDAALERMDAARRERDEARAEIEPLRATLAGGLSVDQAVTLEKERDEARLKFERAKAQHDDLADKYRHLGERLLKADRERSELLALVSKIREGLDALISQLRSLIPSEKGAEKT